MIFYFSCTGNTRWAARRVASVLGDSIVDMAAELRKMSEAGNDGHLEYELGDNERIGFFYPVHGWRPPVLVREFVRRLNMCCYASHYCYAVCTAGDTVGEAEDIFEKDLSEAGLTVQSAISLIMPESYVGLPFMDVDNPETELRKKTVAEKRLAMFIKDVDMRKKGVRDISVGHWPWINSRFIGSLFAGLLIKDTPFRVDAGKCIGCGKCAALCPVDDIKIGADGKPEWLHNGHCLTCFACYHHCPVNAIQFGRRTNGKGQYYYERK